MNFEKYDTQLDTRREKSVICPHCGSVQQDIWEYELEQDDTREIECGNCEKEFFVCMQLNPTYTTSRIKEDRPEYYEFF